MKKEEEVVEQSVIYSYLPNSDQQQFANVFRIDEEEECSLYVLLRISSQCKLHFIFMLNILKMYFQILLENKTSHLVMVNKYECLTSMHNVTEQKWASFNPLSHKLKYDQHDDKTKL